MLAACRAHPIRTAALIGSLIGILQTLVSEISGVLHQNSNAALRLLAPFSNIGAAPTRQTILQTTIILGIEFVANILADALLIVIPVALISLFLRLFRRLRSTRS